MRVTQLGMQNAWIQNLQSRLGKLETINEQIATGKAIAKPSDDPAGAAQIVRISELSARNQQYLENIDRALAVQQYTESVLGDVSDAVMRAKSLAVEGANDASVSVSGSLTALAGEVAGIADSLLQLANTQYLGSYLFSGTSDEVPFGAAEGPYQGDSGVLRVNIGIGQTASVNLTGDLAFREPEARSDAPLPETQTLADDLVFEVSDGTAVVSVTVPAGAYTPEELAAAIDGQFQSAGLNLEARIVPDGALSIAIATNAVGGELTLGDPTGELQAVLGITPGTKNVFGLLSDLETALESGEPEEVGALLDRIDRYLDSLGAERGLLGGRTRNLEATQSLLEGQNITNETLRTQVEGVDLAEAVMRLTTEEQAYETALAAAAKTFNVSLLNFLT